MVFSSGSTAFSPLGSSLLIAKRILAFLFGARLTQIDVLEKVTS